METITKCSILEADVNKISNTYFNTTNIIKSLNNIEGKILILGQILIKYQLHISTHFKKIKRLKNIEEKLLEKNKRSRC